MAKIGLKHIVAAPLKEDGTYDAGYVVAKAIKATVNTNSNDVKLYADDGAAESDKSFKDASLSLNIDDLRPKVYADMLGHEYKAAGTGENASPETVKASAQDVAPFLGIAFYGAVKRNNVVSYLAKHLKKVQFAEPNDETETKGETVAFQTPTIEGTVFPMDDGTWKEQAEFAAEADAIAWVDGKANISEPAGTSLDKE